MNTGVSTVAWGKCINAVRAREMGHSAKTSNFSGWARAAIASENHRLRQIIWATIVGKSKFKINFENYSIISHWHNSLDSPVRNSDTGWAISVSDWILNLFINKSNYFDDAELTTRGAKLLSNQTKNRSLISILANDSLHDHAFQPKNQPQIHNCDVTALLGQRSTVWMSAWLFSASPSSRQSRSNLPGSPDKLQKL